MATLKLSSPWVIYYRELYALFAEDPEVRIIYDEEVNDIKLYVDNPTKAYALTQILPSERVFGNVTLKITVVPMNSLAKSKYSLFQEAFKDNPILSYTKVITGVFANDLCYIVFKHKVVQYFNDDLGDVNGLCSTLYQDIAKRIFGEVENVFFCTDVEDEITGLSLGKQQRIWP